MARIPVCYIAGPFRAPNAWQRELNIRDAENLAFEVAECGAMPLCPHTNTRFFDGTLTDEFWLSGTIELLRRCDFAAFTKRWNHSAGARAEFEFCRANGIRIFYEADIPRALTHWVEDWKARHG